MAKGSIILFLKVGDYYEKEKKPLLGNGIFHPSARPMKIVKDKSKVFWLCDSDCAPKKPCALLGGCWTLDQVIFTRGG